MEEVGRRVLGPWAILRLAALGLCICRHPTWPIIYGAISFPGRAHRERLKAMIMQPAAVRLSSAQALVEDIGLF